MPERILVLRTGVSEVDLMHLDPDSTIEILTEDDDENLLPTKEVINVQFDTDPDVILVQDSDEMTVENLKDALRDKGLAVGGTKSELIERLNESDETYDSWTVEALHDELEDRELPVSGTKAELVARLTEDDASE